MNAYSFASGCDWIESGTLNRIKLIDPPNYIFSAWVYRPRRIDREQYCDACPFHHKSTNVNCTATLGRRDSYTSSGYRFYNINTQQPVRGSFIEIERSSKPRSPVAKVVYKRI